MSDESPCWCGSGDPFALCHRDRQEQAPVSRDALHRYFKQSRLRATCLHFAAGPLACSRSKANAHSVSLRAGLSRIARSGQVYQFATLFGDLLRSQGRPSMRLVGVRRATTFRGFCARHDSELFATLDAGVSSVSAEGAALLLYRALCREAWVRWNACRTVSFMRTLDRGRSLSAQQRHHQLVTAYAQALDFGSRSLNQHKETLDACLRSRAWSDVRFAAFYFDEAPRVLCSGVLYPGFAFQGRALQTLRGEGERPLDMLSVNAIATDGGSAFVLSWHRSSDTTCIPFLHSLASVPNPDVEIAEALLRLVLSGQENCAVSPAWWDSLEESVRARILARFAYLTHPLTPVDPEYLIPDRRFYIAPPLVGVDSVFPDAA